VCNVETAICVEYQIKYLLAPHSKAGTQLIDEAPSISSPLFFLSEPKGRRKPGRCALRGDMFSTRKKEETQTDREDGGTNTPQITLTTSANSRLISTSQDQSRPGDAATSSGRNPTRPPPRPPRPTREVLLNVSAGINSGQQKEADPKLRKLSQPPPIRRYQSEGQFASQAVNKGDEGRSQSEIKPRSFHDVDPTLRLSQWDLISLEMQHGASPRYFRPQDRVPSRYIFH